MSRLFAVEITVEAVIEADDFKHAQSVLDDNVRDILRNEDGLWDVSHEITHKEQLPPGWQEHCLPYGGKDDRAIGYILDNPPPPIVTPDTQTMDLLEVTHSAEGGSDA